MRELTKSMARYGWAMSIFGLQQMVNLMSPNDGPRQATDSFNKVSGAAADTLSASLKSAYHAGDNVQNGMIDMFMNGLGAMDPNRWMQAGARAARQAVNASQQAAQGVANATGQAVRATADATAQAVSSVTPPTAT